MIAGAMPVDPAELSNCPIFGRLGSDLLKRIAESSRLVRLRGGELVFREGQACEGFYVTLSGRVRLYKIGPGGRERTLHVVRAPHAFAEAALFGTGTYPAFAVAMEDVRLVLVPRGPFLALLQDEPAAAFRMFESLGQWMLRLLDQLENETFLSARAKLAAYLLRALRSAPERGSSKVKLTQARKEIASELGMAPETLSRAQADLEQRGLIRICRRTIELVDPGKLEQVLLGWEPASP